MEELINDIKDSFFQADLLLDGVEMIINTHPSPPVCEAGIGAGQVKIMISKNVDNKPSEELRAAVKQRLKPEIVPRFCNKVGTAK